MDQDERIEILEAALDSLNEAGRQIQAAEVSYYEGNLDAVRIDVGQLIEEVQDGRFDEEKEGA